MGASSSYDLTLCNTAYNDERATSVNNKGCPTLEDLLIVGESIRIPRKKAKDIIMHIVQQAADIVSEEFKQQLKSI